MAKNELHQTYSKRYDEVLVPLAKLLKKYIEELLKENQRIDRVTARAKRVESFLNKAIKVENGVKKYMDPLNQIQDQLGVRIVTYYLDDIEPLGRLILDYFGPIEVKRIVPDSVAEFGYEGNHYILLIPDDLLAPNIKREHCPEVFELQIKTLFQYAWAEANHDLAYKPVAELTIDQARKVAFTAAQAWGADHIFNELAQELT